MDRLDIESEKWLTAVLSFDRLFPRVAAKVKSILQATALAGQKWLRARFGHPDFGLYTGFVGVSVF